MNRKLRIGFDVTSFRVARGGIPWYDLSLLRALLEIDRESEYLLVNYLPIRSGRSLPPEVEGLVRPGVRVVEATGMANRRLARSKAVQRIGLRPLAALIDRTLLWPWAAAARASMRRELDSVLGRVDVFHSSAAVQWRPSGGLSVLTIYDMATRVLPDCHSPDERETQDRRHRFARREADVLVAISEQTKRDIVAYLGIDPARIRVVPGGVGPEFGQVRGRPSLRAALAPYGLQPGRYLLHVGTIEARKNLPRLVEAFAQASNFLRPDLPQLAFAGERGFGARDVDASIIEHKVSDLVTVLGRVPQESLPALYAGAIALVYPSLYEGFGLPPLEAMASGTPVIASNSAAISEVVGEAAVLVDPQDVGALGRAIRSVVSDPERRARLRREGLVRASQFTWESAAHRLLDVYRGAL